MSLVVTVYKIGNASKCPFHQRDPVRFDTDSFPCRKGTFAYLHADDWPIFTITVKHVG